MQQSKTGTSVPPPENCATYTTKQGTEVNGYKGSKGSSYVGSQPISSDAPKDYADKMATQPSEAETQAIGNGNVKRSESISPPADLGRGDAYEMQGGRGPGGY